MGELLRHIFGWVCGQDPAHTWSPGGELLPLCQRCTGVYVGAFVAALLHFASRPTPTPRWLWLNGAFLLLMVPLGFHWVPQSAEVRCASGILFGSGLVAFLWLTLPENSRSSRGNEAQSKIGNRQSAISNESEPPHVGCYEIIYPAARARGTQSSRSRKRFRWRSAIPRFAESNKIPTV